MRVRPPLIIFLLLVLILSLLYFFKSNSKFTVDDVSKTQSFRKITGFGLNVDPAIDIRVNGEVNGEGFIYISGGIPQKKVTPQQLGMVIRLNKGKVNIKSRLSIGYDKVFVNYVPVTITQGNLTIETGGE